MSNMSDELLTEELMDYLPLLLRALFHYDKAHASISLPPLQLRVLVVLQRTGALSMSDMAEHLSIQRQQLTKIVDALEEKQLVTRKENVDNRRMLFIETTKQGELWLKEFIHHKSELIRHFFEKLSNEERLIVLQSIAIIETQLKEYLPE